MKTRCVLCEKDAFVLAPYYACDECRARVEADPAYMKCQKDHWQDCQACANLMCCDNMKPEAKKIQKRITDQRVFSVDRRPIAKTTTHCVFKIRDSKTGLFSTGGCEPRWTKTGKSWSTEGQVKSHLNLWSSGGGYRHDKVPESWEVLKFVFVGTEAGVQSARELAERPAKK